MGQFKTAIPDQYTMIELPVALRCVETVMHQLNLSNRFNVRIVQDDGAVINPNSLYGNQDQPYEFVTDAKNSVLVSFEKETYVDNQQAQDYLTPKRGPLVFDPTHGLAITPTTYEKRFKITFDFQFKSRAQAERLHTVLRRRLNFTNQFRLAAEYRIALPDEALYVINEYHRRIQHQYEPDLTLGQYIQRTTGDSFIHLFDVTGNIKGLGFLENQINLQGQYQTTAEPNFNRRVDGIYTTSLDVDIWWQCPVDMLVQYNEVVGHIPLPEALLHEDADEPYEFFADSHDDAFRQFAAVNYKSPYVNYPKWDNFIPDMRYDLHPFISILAIPGDDKRTLLDLHSEFGNYRLSPASVAFMETWRDRIHDHTQTPIFIRVYDGKDVLKESLWVLTDEGKVVLKNEAPDLKLYRVVVCGNLNFFSMDQQKLNDIKEEGDVFKDVADVFLPGVAKDDIGTHPNGRIKDDAFDDIAEKVNKRYQTDKYPRHLITASVGLFKIIIGRQ